MATVVIGISDGDVLRRIDLHLDASDVDRYQLSTKSYGADSKFRAIALAIFLVPSRDENTNTVQIHVCIIIPASKPTSSPCKYALDKQPLPSEEPNISITYQREIQLPMVMLIAPNGYHRGNDEIASLIDDSEEALRSDNAAELCDDCEGGTYFVYSTKKCAHNTVSDSESSEKDSGVPKCSQCIAAVFKPSDEELGAPHNPKAPKNAVQPRAGINPGTGAIREVAAWLLDHQSFAGVPPTALVSVRDWSPHSSSLNGRVSRHEVVGALQRYVPNIGSADEIGPSRYSTRDVHAIGLLDIRLLNIDRHAGNLLCTRDENTREIRLRPIDHGLSLSVSVLQCDIYWEWLHWPQAKLPFSEEIRRYVAECIDPMKDARMLAELGIEAEAVRNAILVAIWVKTGALSGLTLYELATAVCGHGCEQSATLFEEMIAEAFKMGTAHSEECFGAFHIVARKYAQRVLASRAITTASALP